MNGPHGPTISVLVGPSTQLQEVMKAAGVPVPPPVSATFLVDTGASHTVVDADIIKPLGLTPVGAVMIHTPSTAGNPIPMPQYDLMLYVYSATPAIQGWFIEGLPVTASDFSGQQIDGLIGRDIIDRGLLSYSGVTGQFTLAF